MSEHTSTAAPSLHCWAGRLDEAIADHGRFSTEALAALVTGGTCMLPAEHPGPHAYTDDDKIVVRVTGKGEAALADIGP